MITAILAPLTIFVNPVLMTLYILDQEIFIDREATKEDGILMPKEGLPAAITEFYEINAL
jgi:hypothetical protein